jgi:hypothetical protein
MSRLGLLYAGSPMEPPIKVSCPDCGAPTSFRSAQCETCGLVYSEGTRRGALLGMARLRHSHLGATSTGTRVYDGPLVLTPRALYYLCFRRQSTEYTGGRAAGSMCGRDGSKWTRDRQTPASAVGDLDRYCLDARVAQLQGSIRFGRDQVEDVEGICPDGPPGPMGWLYHDVSRDGLRIQVGKAGGKRRRCYDFTLDDVDHADLEREFRRIWGMDVS